MDKLVLTVQIFVLCLFLYKTTLAQNNRVDWGQWVDVSRCTAKPCNCSDRDRVTRPKKDCPKGKVLQVRGCGADRCEYQKSDRGTIRLFSKCYNLNKYCPGWSDWKVVGSCQCEENQTTGKQPVERKCDNPPPMEGSNWQCVINDKEKGLTDSKLANCTCTGDEGNQQTTESTEDTTTSNIRYCECTNSSSNSSNQFPPDYPINNINFDATTTTPGSTLSTTTNPYIIMDYSDDDDEKKLCVCDDTTTDDVTNEPSMTTSEP